MYFYIIQNFVGERVVMGQIHAADLSIALNNNLYKPKENKLKIITHAAFLAHGRQSNSYLTTLFQWCI